MSAVDEAREVIEQEKADRSRLCLKRIDEALRAILEETQCVLDVSLTIHNNGAPNEIRFNVTALDWREQ